MTGGRPLGVWLPNVRTGSGTDGFTQDLADGLTRHGVRAEIAWLPLRAEYAPWSVPVPPVPDWVDLIHVNSWLHGRFYATGGRPVVATSHGCVHDPALRPYKSRLQALYHQIWIRPQEERTLASAAAVTAVSAYTAAQLSTAFALDDVRVIPNWLPPDAFDPLQRPPHEGPFRLIFIGNWSRRKGVDLLAPIMSRLGDEFLLSYTGTPQRDEDLPPNMRPLGWARSRAKVRDWLREADAMLFPSRLEGLPLAVLEAMAVGLPVVAAAVASLPEVIRDGETGLLCPRDDVHAFAAAIRQLRDKPTLREAMQTAALTRTRAEYGEDLAISRYLRLYAEVLGRDSTTLPRAPQ